MHVALIGAPASGKATLAPRLAERFELLRVSPGALLRERVKKRSTLGLLALRYTEQNEPIPEEIIVAVLAEHLGDVPSGQGLLLEAYPNTVSQASHLDEVLQSLGRRLDVVLRLAVTESVVLDRLNGRLACKECRATFHRRCRPFETCPENRCRGEFLYQRDDDQPQFAANRLRSFRRASAPLLERYQRAGKLVIVDANGDAATVEAATCRVLSGFREHRQGQGASVEEFDQLQSLPQIVRPLSADETRRASVDIVFLGGPGSGKGTQAERLARALEFPHIATGDLFRDNLRHQTQLGRLAKTYMDQGELVPDDITEGMVRERLERGDAASGYILDGFPRTLPQAQALTEILAELGRRIARVIHLDVRDETIVKRLEGRLVCKECQRPFHRSENPFVRCPEQRCRGEYLYRRDDDAPETVRARLRTYRAETKPLVAYYESAGLLCTISAEGSIDAVYDRVWETVGELPTAATVAEKASARLGYPGPD